MTYGLDIVTVGIEDEGRVVVRVIMRPQPRGTVVLAPSSDAGAIKFIHTATILRHQSNVNRAVEATLASDPEIRLAGDAEAGGGMPVLGLSNLQNQPIFERRQGLQIECLG